MKPLLSDNSSQSSRITVADKDRTILEDHKLAKSLDNFFKNAVGNLNIKYVINSSDVNSTSPYDPHVNIYILKYRDHPTPWAFTCSKLTIKTLEQWRLWRRSGVFIVNFEHISHLVLVFLLLTLSR